MNCLKRQSINNGSTLIWVMVTALVLTIVLATGLTITSQQHSKAVSTHINSQAYYTALSTTQTIEAWIIGGGEDALDFIDLLDRPDTERTINFTEADLPANTGTCSVTVKNVRTTTDTSDKFKITSTATYLNSTETVSVVMEKNAIDTLGSFTYPVSGFDPVAKYGSTVSNINAGTGGYETDLNPVNIAFGAPNGQSDHSTPLDTASTKRDYNPENRATLANLINTTSSTREATWLETSDIGGLNFTSGPRDRPYIGVILHNNTNTSGPNAKMMLLAPINGKLMINPISAGTSLPTYARDLNDATNIKINQFTISDTAGKSVKLRLGDTGTGARTNTVPKFAYIGLDFYDNNTPMQLVDVPGITNEAVTISNPANVSSGVSTSTVNGVPFYPNTWQDATVYLKNSSSESINSELLFGSYGRIHSSYVLDYRSWANYVTYHWGYQNQNYNYVITPLNITESLTVGDAKNKSGFPFPPVYWGNNFSMYLLDGPQTSEAARIMQGVNIANQPKVDGSSTGVIYSNRATKIGGALTIRTVDQTYEGTRTIMDGFDGYADLGGWVSLPVVQPTYHQVIQNADIVLTTDGATVKNSEILHPDGIKNYVNRTLTIDGGVIYVGNNHTLTIDSEIKDGLEVKGEIAADGVSLAGSARSGNYATKYNYTSNGNRMYIKPEKIEVSAGGTLTILGNQNDHDNVETDIYVNGGTLNISEGAKIKGNIYVYNGGLVNVNGSFRLDSKHEVPLAGQPDLRREDGIVVYGSDAIGKNGITAAGSVCVTGTGSGPLLKGSVISGSANKIHLLGKSEDLFYSKDPRAGKGTYLTASIDQVFSNPADFMCDDYNQNNGECYHFGTKDNGWKSGVYADQ